jgi:hypothetical protein
VITVPDPIGARILHFRITGRPSLTGTAFGLGQATPLKGRMGPNTCDHQASLHPAPDMIERPIRWPDRPLRSSEADCVAVSRGRCRSRRCGDRR